MMDLEEVKKSCLIILACIGAFFGAVTLIGLDLAVSHWVATLIACGSDVNEAYGAAVILTSFGLSVVVTLIVYMVAAILLHIKQRKERKEKK